MSGKPLMSPPPPQAPPLPNGTSSRPGKNYVQVPPGTHPVVVVALVSIFVGGWVGDIINRQVVKGIVNLALNSLCLLPICLIFLVGTGFLGFFLIPVLIGAIHIASLIDAIKIAQRLNNGEPVGDWQCF